MPPGDTAFTGFEDISEHAMEEYTQRFIWCCFALTDAVEKWDKYKEKEQ